ncbi:hypothetical protein [Exiguobacterium algae]|uniref:hypothetical protein n=1 Tax=Exiguobacterium algae TaxID=2751250 RepID=UPI001BE9B99E|nr:hypothetical protein [Exiguobacterium algae]
MNRMTLDELIRRLDLVISRKLSREALSDWAYEQMMVLEQKDGFDWSLYDQKVWECLTTLYGMDLLETPTEYLHDDRDLEEWMRSFEEMNRT